jgi:hypothetical protein
MTYEEFIDFVPAKCMYETIYEDSEGRLILVIDMLSAYGMVNKLQREWVGLTDDEIKAIVGPWGSTEIKGYTRTLFDQIEAKLKEKNQ